MLHFHIGESMSIIHVFEVAVVKYAKDRHVIYISLHHSVKCGYPRRAGFMHLLFLSEQVASVRGDCSGVPPSMSLDKMVEAVKIAIKTTVELFDKPDEKLPP